jgi:hypothetical protein
LSRHDVQGALRAIIIFAARSRGCLSPGLPASMCWERFAFSNFILFTLLEISSENIEDYHNFAFIENQAQEA